MHIKCTSATGANPSFSAKMEIFKETKQNLEMDLNRKEKMHLIITQDNGDDVGNK